MIWTPAAGRELSTISVYLEREAGAAVALSSEQRLRAAADGLSDFPYVGRPATNGARMLATVPPYLIRYRVTADRVLIIGVRHGARRPIG